jgi:hypothetical protein
MLTSEPRGASGELSVDREGTVASYTWIGGLTGDWDDPSNWENVTTGQDDDGYPGAGDTASTLTAGTVTVNSDTAANLDAYAADIVGDITVTNEIFQGASLRACR